MPDRPSQLVVISKAFVCSESWQESRLCSLFNQQQQSTSGYRNRYITVTSLYKRTDWHDVVDKILNLTILSRKRSTTYKYELLQYFIFFQIWKPLLTIKYDFIGGGLLSVTSWTDNQICLCNDVALWRVIIRGSSSLVF